MQAAAFFDLDKTLIARSTVLAFARPLYRARLLTRRDVTRSAYAQLSFISDRADHELMERLRTQLSATITGWPVDALRTVIAEHLEPILTPLLYAEALRELARHRAAGRAVVMVTSTGNDMADPIGVLLGMDHVLSTRMIDVDGRYTGEISDYMYGERKAVAMAELASAQGWDLSACYAYSDSITDLPMLRAVGHPIAVNPDQALRARAIEAGWPILEFSDAPILSTPDRRQKMIMVGVGLAVTALVGYVVVRVARRQQPHG